MTMTMCLLKGPTAIPHASSREYLSLPKNLKHTRQCPDCYFPERPVSDRRYFHISMCWMAEIRICCANRRDQAFVTVLSRQYSMTSHLRIHDTGKKIDS